MWHLGQRSVQRVRRPARLSSPELLEFRWVLSNYDIGPGFDYTSLGAFAWDTLQPGDTVYIHGREQPYREFLLLTESGTAEAPIRVIGVTGPNGELPILDGDQAVVSPSAPYVSALQPQRGLVIVSMSDSDSWGYKPAYIEIRDLVIRNADETHSFTSPTGTQDFFANAAGIFVERGEHITIAGCDVSGCGNGIFVASSDSEATQSREILIQGNSVYGNGTVGSDRQHNAYTEAIGITYEYNHFGPLRDGALGNNIKDRSAGLIVRYNWIEDGAQLLDLVDPEDSSDLALADPRFQQTLVYGNVLKDGSGPGTAGSIVHYGGDTYVFDGYREGTLYFYHNTVIIQANRTGDDGRWQTNLLRLDTNAQVADVRNNIIYRTAAVGAPAETEPTGLTLLKNDGGTAHFGVNWVSPGWITWYNEDPPNGGTVTGLDQIFSPADNDPAFVDLAQGLLELQATSSARNLAGPLAEAVAGLFDLVWQYQVPQGQAPRQVSESAADLGAFEAPDPNQPGTIQFSASQRKTTPTAQELHILVVRQAGTSGAGTVDFATVSGTAEAGLDFVSTSGTLTFADGQTSAEIVVQILAQPATNGGKVFLLQLSNPDGVLQLATQTTLTVTLQAQDAPPPPPPSHDDPGDVGFVQDSLQVPAGNQTVVIQLQRTGDISQSATVTLQLKGSAKRGLDYDTPSLTVTFAANSATAELTLQTHSRPGKKHRLLKAMLKSVTSGHISKSERKLRIELESSED